MDSAITPVNIVTRRPVWEALSTFFLDTDISLSRDYRARILAVSPYSLSELDAILADEVFPVCRWNLLTVAGEWAGFDEQWLDSELQSTLAENYEFILVLVVVLCIAATSAVPRSRQLKPYARSRGSLTRRCSRRAVRFGSCETDS
jgi:hypothetical protein